MPVLRGNRRQKSEGRSQKAEDRSQKIEKKSFNKIFHCLMIIAILFILYPINVFTEPISGNILIEKFKDYNGKTIAFQGEAIGDKMKREKGVWINISDSTGTALGVWFKPEDADKINILGSYKKKGDIVYITGVFNRACEFHYGEFDIHAITCQVIKSGYSAKHEISTNKLKILVTFSIFSIILITLWKMIYKPRLNR